MSDRPFEDLINAVADAEGVPRAVAQAYADTENAERDPDVVRDRNLWGGGSYGLFQITFPTAREYGYAGDPDGLRDPQQNVTFGLRYLLAMYNGPAGGDWSKAAAAYNAGPDMSPWPAAHVARFEQNLAAWTDRYGGTERRPAPGRGRMDRGASRGGVAPGAAPLPATVPAKVPTQRTTEGATVKKFLSRKLFVVLGASIAALLYPPAAPLIAKLASIYVPVQGAVDAAEKVGEAIQAWKSQAAPATK